MSLDAFLLRSWVFGCQSTYFRWILVVFVNLYAKQLGHHPQPRCHYIRLVLQIWYEGRRSSRGLLPGAQLQIFLVHQTIFVLKICDRQEIPNMHIWMNKGLAYSFLKLMFQVVLGQNDAQLSFMTQEDVRAAPSLLFPVQKYFLQVWAYRLSRLAKGSGMPFWYAALRKWYHICVDTASLDPFRSQKTVAFVHGSRFAGEAVHQMREWKVKSLQDWQCMTYPCLRSPRADSRARRFVLNEVSEWFGAEGHDTF